MYKPPLNIIVMIKPDGRMNIKVTSLDDPIVFNISECKYADLVSLEEIMETEYLTEHVQLIYNSKYVDKIRQEQENENIGILFLALFEHDCLLVVDEEREVLVEEVNTI